MTPEEADKAQQWHLLSGSVAWHLIERHAEDWSEVGEMMNAWLRANTKAQEAEEIQCLRALLREALPHVVMSADASHLTDGFKRKSENGLDRLAERIRMSVQG